jgi:hypothetical protein
MKIFAALVALYMLLRAGAELMKDSQGTAEHKQGSTSSFTVLLILGVLALYVLGWAS